MNTKETSDYMNNTCITLFQGYSSVSFFKQLLWTLSKQLKISFFCSLTFSKISTPDYGSFLTLKTFSSHQKWLLLPKTPKQKLSPYSDFPDASLKQPLCPYLFSLPDLPLQQSLQQQPPPCTTTLQPKLFFFPQKYLPKARKSTLLSPACSWPSLHNRKHAPSSRIFLIFTGVALLFVLQIHYLIPLIANPKVTRGQISCSKTSPTWGSTT